MLDLFLMDMSVMLEIKYRQETIKIFGVFPFVNKICYLTIQVGQVVYNNDFNLIVRFFLALGILAD